MEKENYNYSVFDENFDSYPTQNNTKDDGMSIMDFVVTLFLVSIPIVGIIMLIVWLASKDTSIEKKNFLIALVIVGLALAVVVPFVVSLSAPLLFMMIPETTITVG